jgi:hypothetical protein
VAFCPRNHTHRIRHQIAVVGTALAEPQHRPNLADELHAPFASVFDLRRRVLFRESTESARKRRERTLATDRGKRLELLMSVQRNGRRLVSRGEFARMHGVAPQTIDAAIGRGEIVEEIGGGIDPEKGAEPWLARHRQRQFSTDVHAKRQAAELQYLQAKITLGRQALAKHEAEWIDRREAQAKIYAVIKALLEELDHLGEDEPDPRTRAVLQEARRLMKADLADLVPLAARVTDPNAELGLPQPSAEETPTESG